MRRTPIYAAATTATVVTIGLMAPLTVALLAALVAGGLAHLLGTRAPDFPPAAIALAAAGAIIIALYLFFLALAVTAIPKDFHETF